MLNRKKKYGELINRIEELGLIIYAEKDVVDKYNRFILFFSDENYILCTQEKDKVYISFIIDNFGEEKLPTKFIDVLTEELDLNDGWPVTVFEELSDTFTKPKYGNIEDLSIREMKYLMIKSAKEESYLEAAKYRDMINKKNNEL